jgi:nicotinate phosphoribosyltransferase
MTAGQRLTVVDSYGPADEVIAASRRFDNDLAHLPEPARRLHDPTPPRPTLTPALDRLRENVRGGLLDRLTAGHLPMSG